ncbi:hypothetical protein IDG69_14770, partial [Staphylococcus sp. EG-SA-23]|nr:hypothetical protein [Staphylococcus sp. EG-SA-23]
KHAPETKAEPIKGMKAEAKKFDVIGLVILVVTMLSLNVIITQKFDVIGLVILVVTMLSLNVIITQTSHFGLVSPLILGLIVVFI